MGGWAEPAPRERGLGLHSQGTSILNFGISQAEARACMHIDIKRHEGLGFPDTGTRGHRPAQVYHTEPSEFQQSARLTNIFATTVMHTPQYACLPSCFLPRERFGGRCDGRPQGKQCRKAKETKGKQAKDERKSNRNKYYVILHYPPTLLKVTVFDIQSLRAVRRYHGHTSRVSDMTFSPDGRWLVTANMDGGVRVFDLPSGRLLDW